MPHSQISCLWKQPDIAGKYRTAVSLHSHTNQSKESLLFIPAFAEAGADHLLIHCEQSATIHLHRALSHIRSLGKAPGVVLNPGTSLSEIEYVAARRMDIRGTRTLGIDAYMDQHKLDAILFPGRTGAGIAAKAGYPSVLVPAGMIAGVGATQTPEYPFGATFTGRAWSEPVLLRLAYAFEQATKARRMPPGVPALGTGCGTVAAQ